LFQIRSKHYTELDIVHFGVISHRKLVYLTELHMRFTTMRVNLSKLYTCFKSVTLSLLVGFMMQTEVNQQLPSVMNN
jgi:hypothetical protein